jgi:hypothetical protein
MISVLVSAYFLINAAAFVAGRRRISVWLALQVEQVILAGPGVAAKMLYAQVDDDLEELRNEEKK